MKNMSSSKCKKTILAMESIGKTFPGVQALKSVDFNLIEGEVHSLVGANGAGKTTLINILCGIFPDYTGTIRLDGKVVKMSNPKKSRKLGISLVSQEFNLVKDFTVVENIYLNSEPRKFGLIDKRKMNDACSHWLRLLDIKIDPKTKISSLSIVECQLVEIVKALHCKSRILIMDEPTAVLSSKETSLLYDIMNDLRDQNISIIFISHRFEDVFKVSDRVTVLRDGHKVFCGETKSTTSSEIVNHMLGKQGSSVPKHTTNRSDQKVLSAKNITGGKLNDVSFDVYAGEILGIIGKTSSGRQELLKTLFGIERISSGVICLNNKEVPIESPADAIKLGIGFLSEDRKRDGIFQHLPIKDNITIPYLKLFANLGFLKRNRINDITRLKVDELNIKVTSLSQHAISLSGGNQQKVILARWLCNKDAKVFLFEEPTRGIDIGSKVEIYKMIDNLTKKGSSCIIASSDLDELLLLCDRILVLESGSVSLNLKASETSKSRLLKIIMGN
jgi:ribose transport system ATP-binding protein